MKPLLLILLGLCAPMMKASASEMDSGKLNLLSPLLGRKSIQHVDVRLGETVSAPIAIGQINRILLPFDRPEIGTLNPSTAEIQGHVLYIAPVDPEKLYLYVINTDDSDAAIVLSLTPQDIPPREIQLELIPDISARGHPESLQTKAGVNAAGIVPGSSDLTRQLLKTLAMGQIPEGYRFRMPGQAESIRCRQKHLLIQTRQIFDGGKSQIRVGILRNNGKTPQNLNEENCAVSSQVQAVATYPSGALQPGHEAEIFVVVRPEIQDQARVRPVLITKLP